MPTNPGGCHGWAGTFGQAPGAIQIWNNKDGSYTHALGSETISKNVRAFMKEHPEPDTTPLFRDNFTFLSRTIHS